MAMTGDSTKAAVQEYFDRDTAGYLQTYLVQDGSIRSEIFRERRRLVMECLEDPVGDTLNVGSGPGVFAHLLLERCMECWMVDLSLEMVRAGRRLVAAHPRASRIHYQVADVEALPFRGRVFDTTLCIGVLQYLPTPDLALRELSRVTHIGGQVIVSFPNADSPLNRLHQRLIHMARLGRDALRRIGIELHPHPSRLSFRDDIPNRLLGMSEVERLGRDAGLEVTQAHCFSLHFPFVIPGCRTLLRGWDHLADRLVDVRRMPRWGREAIMCFRRRA